MQTVAPFDTSVRSAPIPKGASFRVAEARDIDAVTRLMHIRNPHKDFADLRRTTSREIELNENDPDYWLFVAELEGTILGFCRFFHSQGLPVEKKKFTGPEGWYCMGIIVDPEHRRNSVGRFLSEKRFEEFRRRSIEVVYSMVSSDNPASLRFHESLGFEEIARAPGFMQVAFDCGEGVLFQKRILKA